MAIQKQKAIRTYMILAIVTPIVVFAFQNCAPGFQSTSSSALSSSSIDDDPSFISSSQVIGAASSAKVLSFNLGESNATLTLTIQAQAIGYKISNVSVVTNAEALRFSGLRIWINGSQVSNDTFTSGTGPIAVNSTATFNGSPMIADQGMAPSAQDKIAVGFTEFVIGTSTAPAPTPSATPIPDANAGAVLYTNYCANCHGELNISTKRGRSLIQIQQSIQSVSSMSFLDGTLSNDELAQIAQALQ